MSKLQKQAQSVFFSGFKDPNQLFQLFDFLPDVYCYIKDRDGNYIKASNVVCQVIGVKNEDAVVGKTDFDFFPPAIATQYQDEDRRVIKAAAPLLKQVWLVPGANGVPRIYLCNKIPLFDEDGEIVGIAGIKRPYDQTMKLPRGYGRLIKVVEFVSVNYFKPITVQELADKANLSTSQLNREFVTSFGIVPSHYIREVRIGVARHMIETSDNSMADIAGQCGFYDQSHFTRQFKDLTGLTPLQYRKRFKVCSPAD